MRVHFQCCRTAQLTCGKSTENRTYGTCGKRAVNACFFFPWFFFSNKHRKIEMSLQKKRVVMKNVCYLSVLVVKVKCKKKCEDKNT
jgi:hypothetical protein